MTLADKAFFGNYDPSSFGWRIEPDLVPFTFDGVNFGRCARDVLPVFVALLTELEPHIPGGISFGPADDWAYSATDELPDGSPSFHHYGVAFDLNWRENPMGNYTNNPDAGQKGAIPYQWANDIATKHGCEYGGSWSGGPNRLGFKDYMHFECHLSPADARAVKPPTKEFVMDAEVKAAFDKINARLDSHEEILRRNDHPHTWEDANGDVRQARTFFHGVQGYKDPPAVHHGKASVEAPSGDEATDADV